MTAVALTAALVSLGVSVLALLIVLGVTRRVRAGGLTQAGANGAAILPSTGFGVPEFQFIDAAGIPVSSARLASGRHVLAFVSSACDPCRDSLPEFVSLADVVGADQSLAIFADDGDDRGVAAAMLGQLRRGSTILIEGVDGEVSRLFGVDSFPTFVGVEDGVVQMSSHRVADLVRWHGR